MRSSKEPSAPQTQKKALVVRILPREPEEEEEEYKREDVFI